MKINPNEKKMQRKKKEIKASKYEGLFACFCDVASIFPSKILKFGHIFIEDLF